MKPEHKQYILENLNSKSLKEIAQHLQIKEKNVRKFVEREKMKENFQENRNDENMPSQKRKWICSIAVIILAGFMVYGNALNGQFIWDDERLIQDNPVIKNWEGLSEIFTSTLRTPLAEATSAFRPLQIFTYLINYSIGRLDVFGYHLTNIIFHILTALVFFWLVQILFRDILLSVLAALIFIIHPVHTEAVAYISGRADVMVAFFMILSFCVYLKNTQKLTILGFSIMCLSFLGALLSRENALIFPVLILLYHFTYKNAISKKAFLGILCTVMVYAVWRWMVFQGLTVEQSTPTTFWQRTPGLFVALANYIRLLLVPFDLHMEYGGLLFNWNEPKIYIGLALLLSLLFLAYKKRKDHRVLFPIGWFIITLLPAMNIVPLNSYMAEHWLYIPSMGYAMLIAYLLVYLYRKNNVRLYAVMLGVGLTLYYAGMTITQNGYWRDPIRFYKRTLGFNPTSTRLYTNLAGELLKAGQSEDLIRLLKIAIDIDPANAVAYNNLGNAYKGLGKIDEAINIYNKSISLNPDYAGPYYNLGVIYNDKRQDSQKAISYLQKAIAKDSTMYRAYHKLGRIYLDQDHKDKAITMLNKALTVNPDAPNIYHSLAYVYFQSGDVDEAVQYYKKTIELDPRHGEAYNNLAIIFYRNQQYRQAVQHCDKAVALGHVDEKLLEALKPYR